MVAIALNVARKGVNSLEWFAYCSVEVLKHLIESNRLVAKLKRVRVRQRCRVNCDIETVLKIF